MTRFQVTHFLTKIANTIDLTKAEEITEQRPQTNGEESDRALSFEPMTRKLQVNIKF